MHFKGRPQTTASTCFRALLKFQFIASFERCPLFMSTSSITLLDGTPLTAEQMAAFTKLAQMVESTISSKVCQTSSKEEHVLAGVKLLPESRSFLSAKLYRRYLCGRNWEPKKAYDSIMHTIFWRAQTIPPHFDKSRFTPCLASRYMEWIGHDVHGRPSLFIKSNNADLEIPRETRLEYLIVAMEKGLALMDAALGGRDGVEQWNMIVDETDKEMKHMDTKFLTHVAPIIGSHYVERLHRCYIINPGVLTSMVLGAIKLFVDERTSDKLCKLEGKIDKKTKLLPLPQLVQELGEENVPVYYGGKMVTLDLPGYTDYFHSIPPTGAPPTST
jgi:hypothetical protein